MSEKSRSFSATGTFECSPVLGSGTQNVTYKLHMPAPSRNEGFKALENDQYALAARVFGDLLVKHPDDAGLRLGLALSLLEGRHPCRCDVRTLEQVKAHLMHAQRLAPRSPNPRLALLLVRDAELFRWSAQRRRPTKKDLRLLNQVKRGAAAMLIKHIPARESVLWQELARVAGDGRSPGRAASASAQRLHKPPRRRSCS
ncbi:hypothetical protein [Streptomyces thermoalcalitolerans]|uniref:Uncharacterized protein n=1 Tax=Streptomyces thermoalcalitolerans TaxID=65605 RepID=A0ABN1ND86_9ACTN